MNTTFLGIGVPFLLIGVFFSIGGGLMVGSTFVSLGLVFLALGVVLGGDDESERPSK